MTSAPDHRRRALVCGPLVSGLLAAMAVAPGAWAQDPVGGLVQKTARDWLVMVDQDDGAGSWKAAGKKFQGSMTADAWTRALADAHLPMGKTEQRAVIGTSFDKSFPGAPEGEYATVDFRTSFVGRKDAREVVTLERESDGVWRVTGYSIR